MNWDLLEREKTYLVGVSGGVDSVYLLHQLHEAHFDRLIVCHFNHQLRGPQSEEDEAFVLQLAQTLNLPFESARAPIATLAQERKESVETCARHARHAFFQEMASRYDAHALLLAHHLEDQAETVLFNLCRGSHGLKGMKAISEVGPLTILRPLLNVRKQSILSSNLAYRQDASNFQSIATRNRLRLEAIPLLSEILGSDVIPKIAAAAHRTAEIDFISSFNLLDPQGRLYLPAFTGLPPALHQTAMHQFLKRVPVPNLTSIHIQQVTQLATRTTPPAQINLPGRHRARRAQKRLWIEQF